MEQMYKVKETQEAQGNRVCGKNKVYGEGETFFASDLLDAKHQLKNLKPGEPDSIIEIVKQKELPPVSEKKKGK